MTDTPAEQAMDTSPWHAIETVPRTPVDEYRYGPTVLLWFADEGIGIGFWDEDFDDMYREYPIETRSGPTHWMPLPNSPQECALAALKKAEGR